MNHLLLIHGMMGSIALLQKAAFYVVAKNVCESGVMMAAWVIYGQFKLQMVVKIHGN